MAADASLRDKVVEELWSYAILVAYVFVCFSTLLYMKAAILEAEGVSFAPWGLAFIKSLIVAKFMLILRRFDGARPGDTRPLIVPTLYKSLGLVAILAGLMVAEEALVGYLHGRGIHQSLHELGGGTLHQRVATIAIMILIFMPMFAFRSLGDVFGHNKLWRLFFHGRAHDNRNMDQIP